MRPYKKENFEPESICTEGKGNAKIQEKIYMEMGLEHFFLVPLERTGPASTSVSTPGLQITGL